MATVLSGTSGALYYTPAGTSVTTLVATAFPATGSNITVGTYLGFKVNDPVTLTYPVGATTTNAIAAGAYFVKTYVPATGIMTISSTAGGAAATAGAYGQHGHAGCGGGSVDHPVAGQGEPGWKRRDRPGCGSTGIHQSDACRLADGQQPRPGICDPRSGWCRGGDTQHGVGGIAAAG